MSECNDCGEPLTTREEVYACLCSKCNAPDSPPMVDPARIQRAAEEIAGDLNCSWYVEEIAAIITRNLEGRG